LTNIIYRQLAYIALVLPIASSQFASFTGHKVPFEVTIFTFVLQLQAIGQTHRHCFSDAVFQLSGLVNVILFTTTRRILPPQSMKFNGWSISRPRELPPTPDGHGGDPYYQTTQVQPEVKMNWSRPSSSHSSLDGFSVGSNSSQHTDAKRIRREKSRPPDIIIRRVSEESMYSVYDEEEVRNAKRSALQPKLSSQWSPDGSPQRRYVFAYLFLPHPSSSAL
jgi:hypothetical protein